LKLFFDLNLDKPHGIFQRAGQVGAGDVFVSPTAGLGGNLAGMKSLRFI
jgi:hypothetical protein